MTTFIETFKAKAHSKTLTAADMIALCVYKTVKAKSEDKPTILTHFLKKAFTAGKVCAHRQYPYQSIWDRGYSFFGQLRPAKRWGEDCPGLVLDTKVTELLTEEEIVKFRELANMLSANYYEYVRNL